MVKVIVLLREPNTSVNPAEYSQHYNEFLMALDHLPLLRRKAVCDVYAGPGGFTAYNAVVELFFNTREDLQAALTSPEGVEAGQVLLKFAGSEAVTLFANVLEEAYDQI